MLSRGDSARVACLGPFSPFHSVIASMDVGSVLLGVSIAFSLIIKLAAGLFRSYPISLCSLNRSGNVHFDGFETFNADT